MRQLVALLALALILVPAAQAGVSLAPAGRIGPGWRDKAGWMSFVAFRRDGRQVVADAAATLDDVSGGMTVWSFPTGRLVRRVPDRPGAISPDFRYYATANRVADLSSGRTVASLPGANAFAAYAFSPDSRYVAESAPEVAAGEPHIQVFRLSDGRPVGAFGQRAAFAMAFSPNGATLATGHWDEVALTDVRTGRRLGALRGFGRYVVGLSYSPGGELLAAGADLGVLQLWDVRRRRRLWTIDLGGGDVSTPAFSPDGRLVAVGVYGTGTAWLIDVRAGKLAASRKISDLGCGSLAFSPDGRFLIAPSTGGLVTWPYDRGGSIRVFRVRRAMAGR